MSEHGAVGAPPAPSSRAFPRKISTWRLCRKILIFGFGYYKEHKYGFHNLHHVVPQEHTAAAWEQSTARAKKMRHNYDQYNHSIAQAVMPVLVSTRRQQMFQYHVPPEYNNERSQLEEQRLRDSAQRPQNQEQHTQPCQLPPHS